jgi:hypothetical protein
LFLYIYFSQWNERLKKIIWSSVSMQRLQYPNNQYGLSMTMRYFSICVCVCGNRS